MIAAVGERKIYKMALDLNNYIASIPDYPEKGIIFRDVTPLMADGEAYRRLS